MKIELNKIYKTKRGIPVKITMKTAWGFFGTLQDDSKLSVKYKENGIVPDRGSKGSLLDIEKPKKIKYDENGKVVGWATGNANDIKGSDEDEETEKPPTR